MKILYTCDNNYVWLMSISMISLFKTNSKVDEIVVYLIGENITQQNKEILKEIAKEYHRECQIIDLPQISIPKNLYSKRWPKSAFARLYCADLLPYELDKVIYLDCDTIIKNDISELWEINNKQYPIYGVKDCISGLYKKNIGLCKDASYINCGVLLINLDLLKKLDISTKINEFVDKYGKVINYADQDLLNGILKNNIGVLESKFNVMTIEFMYKYKDILTLRKPSNYYSKEDVENAINNPYIIHYTTNMTVVRPWYNNSNHPRKDDFINVFNQNNFFDITLMKYKFSNKKDKILKIILYLPKFISYHLIGMIHGILLPILKNILIK